MSITKILPAGPVTSTAHADVLLELGYLITAADGKLAKAEIDAYREIASRVRGTPASEEDVGALLDRFGGSVTKSEIESRVRAIAPTLPPDLREVAFKLVIGLALADDEAHDDENALVGVLFEALGLAEARADALAEEVREAFSQT
jgi:hypothetical protein